MTPSLPLTLAPMAGVTDKAFRYMCKKHGADRLVTEMVSAKAVCFGDEKTALLARIDDGDLAIVFGVLRGKDRVLARGA